MKDISMLVFLTQLGLSVVMPLAGFILLGVWLHQQLQWGVWVVIVATAVGVICAVEGLRSMLKAMERMTKDKKKDPPAVSFNDHD